MPGARRSASLPFNIENAAPKQNNEADGYSDETFRILSEMMLKDSTLTAVNAATPAVLGFGPEVRRSGNVCRTVC